MNLTDGKQSTIKEKRINISVPIPWCSFDYAPHTMKLLGGILVSLRPSVHASVRLSVHPSVCTSVCPSVRPTSNFRSVVPTLLVGFILYLYILSSNFTRCVACKGSGKILQFKFLAIFLNLYILLRLVLTWDLMLMWIVSMGNHGAVWGGGVIFN